MNNDNDIFFEFPLRKDKPGNIYFNLIYDENKIEENLRIFYKPNADIREDERNQEYFLIYNSYTLDKL